MLSLPGENLALDVAGLFRSRLGVQANIELQLQVVGRLGTIQVQLHVSDLLNQSLIGVLEPQAQGDSVSSFEIWLVQTEQ